MFARQTEPALAAAVSRLLQGPPSTAVFDADGTLWNNDANEQLLGYIDEHDLISAPEGSGGLLAYNNALFAKDRRAASIFAAVCCAGQRLETLLQWSEASFQAHVQSHVRVGVSAIVAALLGHGWRVLVVSASPAWAILPGTDRLGIPRENVLALHVAVEEGVVTDRAIEPITIGAGKVARLEAHEPGLAPALCAGNSVDDIPMLAMASDVAVVVDPGHPHAVDEELLRVAGDRGWFVHGPIL